MRRAAIAAFVAGIVLYPLSFILTIRALGGEFAEENVSSRMWFAGRALAVATVALFAFSVAAAFFTTERARRVWWAVPATVLAIAVAYFDLIGFGF
jgi:hypothetical protein